ncbi:MAG TPA: response regulator transcription factor [Acidimicrobiia bacterium]|nr:response regulator transcription factor [Acidimicrobiia bacterium]
MRTVLVVDDELKITRLVRDYLEQAGFVVAIAADGPGALAAARQLQPDLIVLDLGLPGMDGLDVIRSLRTVSMVPVVVLTARAEEADRVVGLELGADDYLVKPFSPTELVARVRAVLRRTERLGLGPEVVRVGDLTIDQPRRQVSRGDTAIELTPTEFDLLRFLARQPGRVFTRGQLLEAIHGVAFDSYERAIDAHVKNLRHKLEPDPRRPRYLLTVHGVGYKMADA